MDLFPNLLDVPVGLSTREMLKDNDKCPWMGGESGEDEWYSYDVGDTSQVCLTGLVFDEEFDDLHSPSSDTGISSAGSQYAITSESSPSHDSEPHDTNPVVNSGNKTRNQGELDHQKNRLATKGCKGGNFDTHARPNISKNAIAARENRMKKKKYIEELEQKVQLLTEKSAGLELETEDYKRRMERAEVAVEYLCNVVANVEELKGLVKSVQGGPCGDMLVGSKVLKRHRGKHDGDTHRKKQRIGTIANITGKTRECLGTLKSAPSDTKTLTGAGVCFHVNGGKISLELCSYCSQSAAEPWL